MTVDHTQPHVLYRLALVALRRTAFANSVQLLAVLAIAAILLDGVWRASERSAIDAWFAGAILWAISLPTLLAHDDPLRSLRLALLPVAPRALRRVRFFAGAPLRLLLVLIIPVLGAVWLADEVGPAAMLSLVGWMFGAYIVGDALDALSNAAYAGAARVGAIVMVAVGGLYLSSLHTGRYGLAGRIPAPALLPWTSGAEDWMLAGLAVVACVMLSVARIRSTRPIARDAMRSGSSARPGGSRTPPLFAPLLHGAAHRLGPRNAAELVLLTRHLGPRVSLALAGVFGLVSAYGQVPGLALLAALPLGILSANALGADVPLGGVFRHALLPETTGQTRDRRLSMWAIATACVGLFGAAIGTALPTPPSSGQPIGGRFAAPVMLLFSSTLVVWFGRASWWWARRYPQPLAQRLRDLRSVTTGAGPLGHAPHALVLFASWGAVAIAATACLTACVAMTRAVAMRVATRLPPALAHLVDEGTAWNIAVLLATVLSFAAYRTRAGQAGRAGRLRTITPRVGIVD